MGEQFVIRAPGHPGLVNGSLFDGFLEDWDSFGFQGRGGTGKKGEERGRKGVEDWG